MRVLVTGGSGFLGAWVSRVLAERGDSVVALLRPGRDPSLLRTLGAEPIEGDLLDEPSLRRACLGAEGLVHCAAMMGSWSRRDAEQRRVNVDGSSALYRAAHAAGLRRIVHVSSVAAIGATRQPVALDEGARWNGFELGLNYVLTKRESEERARAAARGGVPITIVNPAAIFGPRLDGRPTSSLAERIAAGQVRRAPRGGLSVTDVEDVARGIAAALSAGRVDERYILGGHNLAWREFYAAVARSAGAPREFAETPAFVPRLLLPVAQLIDGLGLSSPRTAPERLRSQGWYTFVSSARAEAELGYRVRPLDEILQRTLGPVHSR